MSVDQSEQAVWDAAWALHDPDPSGQQWRRSKALKDAIAALIAVQHDSATDSPLDVQQCAQCEGPMVSISICQQCDGSGSKQRTP
jgi:hypothetical protein